MRLAEHGSAAPRAGVRAAARGDQRHRAEAVALAPGAAGSDGRSMASRSGNGCASRSGRSARAGVLATVAVLGPEHDAVDRREIASRACSPSLRAQRTISSSSVCSPSPIDDDVGAGVEVRARGAADRGRRRPPSRRCACAIAIIAQRVALGHQVDGDADDRRPLALERRRRSPRCERNVPSNTPTSKPRAFRCDDRYSRPSGGCGRIMRCSSASSRQEVAVREQDDPSRHLLRRPHELDERFLDREARTSRARSATRGGAQRPPPRARASTRAACRT